MPGREATPVASVKRADGEGAGIADGDEAGAGEAAGEGELAGAVEDGAGVGDVAELGGCEVGEVDDAAVVERAGGEVGGGSDRGEVAGEMDGVGVGEEQLRRSVVDDAGGGAEGGAEGGGELHVGRVGRGVGVDEDDVVEGRRVGEAEGLLDEDAKARAAVGAVERVAGTEGQYSACADAEVAEEGDVVEAANGVRGGCRPIGPAM